MHLKSKEKRKCTFELKISKYFSIKIKIMSTVPTTY